MADTENHSLLGKMRVSIWYPILWLFILWCSQSTHAIDVLLTVDLADEGVHSSDTVNVTVCHGQSSALNFTCRVEGKPDNLFLPRICLVQRNKPIQHISYSDKGALEKNNISISHHSQNLLQFEHKISDSKTAGGLIVYCELENTASAKVAYREVSCLQDATTPGPTTSETPYLVTTGTVPINDSELPFNNTDPKTKDINDKISVTIIAAVAVAACCVLIVVTICIFAALYCIVPRCCQRGKVTDHSNQLKSKLKYSFAIHNSFGVEETGGGNGVFGLQEHPTSGGDYFPEHGQLIDVQRVN